MTTKTQPPTLSPKPFITRPAATSGGVPSRTAVPAMIAVVLALAAACITAVLANEPETFELAPQAITNIERPEEVPPAAPTAAMTVAGAVTARSI